MSDNKSTPTQAQSSDASKDELKNKAPANDRPTQMSASADKAADAKPVATKTPGEKTADKAVETPANQQS